MTASLSNVAAALVAGAEGYRSRAYDDATGERVVPGYTMKGHVTIGYGRALDVDGVTVAEAVMLRDNSVAAAIADARTVFGPTRWSTLDLNRQAALVDMAYELGRAGLAGFRAMIAALDRGDWPAAHDAALASAWAGQVAGRAERDAKILLTGQLPA
jgi:lysozyme